MRAWIWGVVVAVAACGPVADEAAPTADVTPGRRTVDAVPERGWLPRERELHLPRAEEPPPAATHPHPNARFIQVAAASHSACGVMSDRTLWCWSETRGLGQVGLASDWSSVSHGESHSCALRLDGTLWCWGENHLGQLGLGRYGGTEPAPRQVGAASNWAAVAVAQASTCGIRTDGTLWCWGILVPVEAIDFPASSDVPALISSDGHWRSISFEDRQLCTVNATGGLQCWVQLYGGAHIEVVHHRPPFAWRRFGGDCGIRSDGTFWCGGPSRLERWSSDTDWATFTDGPLLLRNDRTLWRWRTGSPEQVGNQTWLQISAAGYGCGIRTDGTTWCWNDPAQPTQIHP